MNKAHTSYRVTPAVVDAFQRDGAVCLRGAIEEAWLDDLERGLEKNFTDPGPDGTVYTPEGGPGGFYDDYCNWQRIPEYESFVRRSPAGQIVGSLMRSSSARFYHEHVIVKEPGTQELTPWHHDVTYYGVDGQQLCSMWLPLDPVPLRACPEFVAGSHRSGINYYPRLFISQEDYGANIEGFQSIPDIDADRDRYEILSWDLERGDCIVFHMRTLHSAPGTPEIKTRRRGFSTRWLGDDARFATRAWTTSPPFREVDLEPGAPMEHPLFPVVWSIDGPT